MRIAFYSDNFFPEMSGISDSIIILGRELVRQGHEVAYIAARYPDGEFSHMDTIKSTLPGHVHRIPSLPFRKSPTGQSRIVMPFGHSLPFIKKFKPDIIHTQSPFGIGIEALYASKFFDIPLIGTNHTNVDQFGSYSPISIFHPAAFMRTLYAWYYNRCRIISTPNASLLELMRSYGLRAKGLTIANPILVDLFTPPSAAEKAELKKRLGARGIVVLSVGRLAPEKHPDVTIRAVAVAAQTNPDIKLIIAGRGIMEPELKKLATELGIEGNIIWAGFVEPFSQPLIDLYRTSDIYAMPSTSEIHPLALMQAYAVGMPAIGADALGFREYLPADCGFLIEPGDHAALASHINELATDSSKRQMMGHAARNLVKTFAPEHIASQWITVYNDSHDANA